jgi:hypothetical protein
MTLPDDLAILELSVPRLKAERNEGPLQNDVYEAVDDLCHFGRRAIANDTRINYSTRAESDLALFRKLRSIVADRGDKDRDRYQELLDSAVEFLLQIAQIPLRVDGHLGVLKVIRSRLGFLFEQYGFAVCDERPTGVRLKSGHVCLELGWATASSLSFALTKDDVRYFWLEDLLYLYHDQRYEKVPLSLDLRTEGDVASWFEFVAGVLEEYGGDLLTDQPGSWDQLARAQSKRDAEHAAMTDARHGRN